MRSKNTSSRNLTLNFIYQMSCGAMRRCIVRFLLSWEHDGARERETFRVATCPARDPRGPQKPPFLACQKVAPPPCKKPPFLHFPRRKACNFDRIVHENAHF